MERRTVKRKRKKNNFDSLSDALAQQNDVKNEKNKKKETGANRMNFITMSIVWRWSFNWDLRFISSARDGDLFRCHAFDKHLMRFVR